MADGYEGYNPQQGGYPQQGGMPQQTQADPYTQQAYQQQQPTTYQQPQVDPYAQQQAYQQPQADLYAQQTYQQPQQQPAYNQAQPNPYAQQQAYQQPQQQMYAQPQPYGTPMAASNDSSSLFIGLSIAEILLLGGLFAIIPLVFSIQYKNALQAGDYMTAEAKKKTAKTCLIVIPIVAIVLIFIALFIPAMMSR